MPSIISFTVDSHIAHIQLTNSAASNRISVEFLERFKYIIKTIDKDKSIQAVFISAKGEFFCDGFDFKELSNINRYNISRSKRFIHWYQKLLYLMCILSKPIVVVVNGKVRAGGVGIIAASDYVIATDNASFELGELLFGLIPAAVMPYLSRRIPIQILKRIILTTQLLDAQAALRCGMIDRIIERNHILPTIKTTSKHLLRLNSFGVKTLKLFAIEVGDGKKIRKLSTKSGNVLCNLLFRPNVISNIRALMEFGTSPMWFTKYTPDQVVLKKMYE